MLEYPAPFQNLRPILEHSSTALGPLLPRLAGVIKDREEDFLRLGSQVFHLNSLVGRFSDSAADLASAIGGQTLHVSITELRAQAEHIREAFGAFTMTEHLEDMDRAVAWIHDLGQGMREFDRLVRTLKMLGVTTRIESARLGSAGSGFSTLADDVDSLAAKIVQHAAKIRDHCQHLLVQVKTAREQTTQNMQDQAQTVEVMFSRLFANIVELEAMRERSVALVDSVALGSNEVARDMGQIVASVQFHDITRQQVEHVEEILRQIVTETCTPPDDDSTEAGLAAWTRDALRLQGPQLAQAREMFNNAVQELIARLLGISHHIRTLNKHMTGVAYSGEHHGQSVLNTIRQDIGQVVQTMHQAGEHAAATGQIMNDVAQTIAQVGEFIADIEDVGSEIELIALNASVKAAHTGEQGLALGVLAVAIQHLSGDAGRHTQNVTEKLTTLSATAGHLSRLAQDTNIETLLDKEKTKFFKIFDNLDQLDEGLRSGLADLSNQGTALSTDLDQLASSIDFHHLVAKELNDLKDHVTALAAWFEPHAALLETAEQPKRLQEQLQRYTMESQRLVHLSVLGREHSDTPATSQDDVELFDDGVELFDASPTDEARDDDYGDNVELF